MNRKPIETALITVLVRCDVQDNGDGTWTASIRFPRHDSGPVTRDSKYLALLDVSQNNSAIDLEKG